MMRRTEKRAVFDYNFPTMTSLIPTRFSKAGRSEPGLPGIFAIVEKPFWL